MPPQASLRFPGLQQIIRWSFTLSHGTSPGVATIDIVPQFGLPDAIGPLEIEFASTRLRFRDCSIDHALLRRTREGTIIGLTLFDRRWKWKFGAVSGRYNQRTPAGQLDTNTEQTPHELATRLLEALGESGFSVAELPNSTRPAVDWVAANPAAELHALCSSLGCRIVLGLDDRVTLRRIGSGDDLPALPVQRTQSFGIAPPARPDALQLVGGASRFQTKFRLEAVGLDNDGSIRPIDKLAYAPAEGWRSEPFEGFPNLTTADARSRATLSVYRWYRIKCTAPDNTAGTFRLPGNHGPVSELWQVLPLETGLIDTERGPDGIERPQPPIVEGIFWPHSPDGKNVPATRRCDVPFRLEPPRGLVKFERPVMMRNSVNDGYEPAELYLTTAHPLLEEDDRTRVRYSEERPVPAPPTGAGYHIVRREELVETFITRYAANHSPTRVETNTETLSRDATAALDAALAPFETRETAHIEYAGIIPIAPDGAIYQVAWTGTPDGAVTRAARLHEFSFAVPHTSPP